MAGSMNQFWTGGNFSQPMPGYNADPNARPVAFDQATANNYLGQNAPFAGRVSNPESMSQPYRDGKVPGTVPTVESVSDWNRVNGYNQGGQGGGGVQTAPTIPPNQWQNPSGGAPAASTPPGGSGSYNSYLQDIMGKVNAYDPSKAINSAFDLQTQQAAQQMGSQWDSSVGARGLLPSDNTSQDLRAVLTGKVMAPLAAQRAAALADAQGGQLSQQMNLAQLLAQDQRAQQELEWRKAQAAADAARDQRNFDYDKGRDATNDAWNQTQRGWQTNDRLKAETAANTPQPQQQAPGPGAAPAGGGGSFYDLIANNPSYATNGVSSGQPQQQAPQSGGYAGGGGGTTFLPPIDAGSNSGLWRDGRGGTTWHNPANQRPPFSGSAGQRPVDGGASSAGNSPSSAGNSPSSAGNPLSSAGNPLNYNTPTGWQQGAHNSSPRR